MSNIFGKIILVFTLLACCTFASFAQQYSVSTNLVEWGNLGTINAEAGMSVARHFSIHAGVRYNPWTFREGNPEERFTDIEGINEKEFANRKRAYALGVRYWPWYIYSGWWFYGRGQYMEYSRGGLINKQATEGDAFGLGVGFGYTYLLRKNWNVEFGTGIWGGYRYYKNYRCPNCGTRTGSGQGWFVLPDDVFLSLIYVF